MRYGLPYKGSKNTIAEWVVSHFPQREHFYDLFCGGCAITHAAMLAEKFSTYTINDVLDMPQLFIDAIGGKYRDEKRWISREDFQRLKDTDPYVKTCWSFGNSGRDYLYSKEIEPWKKALHYARVLGDLSLLEAFGIKSDGSRLDIKRNSPEYREKYIKWYMEKVILSQTDCETLKNSLKAGIRKDKEELRQYLLDGLRKAGKKSSDVDRYLGTNGMASHYFGASQWQFPTREVYIKLQSFLYLPEDYDSIYGLQYQVESLERLQRLESLQRLQSLESLELFRGDYQNVKIKPNSLIYCDIPYRGTDGYSKAGFDHERFYSWAERQTEPVIISEYDMPAGRFICIDGIEKLCTLDANNNSLKKNERLFIPRTQEKLFIQKKTQWKQPELF